MVSQWTQQNLIDEFRIAQSPIVLGKGRTMFEGVQQSLNLKLMKSRAFGNGTIFAGYQRAA